MASRPVNASIQRLTIKNGVVPDLVGGALVISLPAMTERSVPKRARTCSLF